MNFDDILETAQKIDDKIMFVQVYKMLSGNLMTLAIAAGVQLLKKRS